jgi:hypothetical protein
VFVHVRDVSDRKSVRSTLVAGSNPCTVGRAGTGGTIGNGTAARGDANGVAG